VTSDLERVGYVIRRRIKRRLFRLHGKTVPSFIVLRLFGTRMVVRSKDRHKE